MQKIDRVVMWMGFYRPLARTLRWMARPFTYMNAIPDLSGVPEPVVFVSRHRNMRGPLFTLLHLPREVHPWVFSVFCDRKRCYNHFLNYTLSVRMKWHSLSTVILARVLSWFVPVLVKSIGGIPVFRKSIQVKKTFSQSLEALKRGESIIIYPDVDYTSTDDTPGEIYSGFLLIGQMYRKATGKNLQFVPLDVDMRRRALLMGNPVVFDGKRNFSKERERAAIALRGELANLGSIISRIEDMVSE